MRAPGTQGRKIVDVLSGGEILRIADAAVPERDKLMVRVLAGTGIRVGGTAAAAGDLSRDPGTGSEPAGWGARAKERLILIVPGL